jgi:hypothetical protein
MDCPRPAIITAAGSSLRRGISSAGLGLPKLSGADGSHRCGSQWPRALHQCAR